MQAGKNISSSEIFSEQNETHPYRCVGGNGLRGFVARYNTSGHNAIVGRQGALCGCLNIEQGNYYATEHAVVVDTYEILPPKFMYYFLTALNLNQYATATAQPGLAVSNIIEVLFPLPPYQEQIRITRTLHELNPLINQFYFAEERLSQLTKAVTDKLKSSILQEAIQGKLVPQMESEGTAEDLLTEIRDEKQRLVKEGKLKKSAIANESRIFRGDDNKYREKIGNKEPELVEELPFEIPSSWVWIRLGELFDHNTGKALNGKGTGTHLLKYLTTSNLYWDRFDFTKVKEMYFSENEIEKCSIRNGDLLVCEGGDIGRAAIWSFDYEICIQNHIHRLRPFIKIDVRFYLYILMYYKAIGMIGGRGIGIQGLSSKALHDIIIPVPPRDEQARIVKFLDKTLASIMSR